MNPTGAAAPRRSGQARVDGRVVADGAVAAAVRGPDGDRRADGHGGAVLEADGDVADRAARHRLPLDDAVDQRAGAAPELAREAALLLSGGRRTGGHHVSLYDAGDRRGDAAGAEALRG